MFFEVGILKCVVLTFNWLTFTSKMYFVKFHPSCHSPEEKERIHPWKLGCYENTFKKLFSGIPLNFHFVLYLRNYKEFKAEILDLQKEKYGISFDIKKCTTSGWALGDENVIGIRAVASLTVPGGQEFHFPHFSSNFDKFFLKLYLFPSSFWPSGWVSRPPGKALATPLIGIFIFQLNSPGGGVAINSQIFIKRVTTGKNEKVDSLHVPAIG